MKKSMITRIILGLALTLFFVLFWFLGGLLDYANIIYMVGFSIINALCVFEMNRVMKAKNYKIAAFPLFVFAILMPVILSFYKDLSVLLMLGFICSLITILARIFNKNGKNEDMIAGLFVYLYPLIPLACLFKVCTIGDAGLSRLTMLVTFACPLLGDTLAYFFGVSFGKRKLCEHISPKKTIAGSVGGVIGGALGGCIVYFLQAPISKLFNTVLTDFSLAPLIIVGLLLGMLGQIGDLFASCIKRWAGVKDYGNIFPGHGGMMDRIDSVMMCSPLVLLVFTDTFKHIISIFAA